MCYCFSIPVRTVIQMQCYPFPTPVPEVHLLEFILYTSCIYSHAKGRVTVGESGIC